MFFSLFERVFLRFLRRTMGCFFGCFRVRDDRRPPIHLVSQPITSRPNQPVKPVARNRLSSLLLFEAEGRDHSPCEEGKHGVIGSPISDNNSNELKAEAKFLKACGTLPQTPAEIRNADKLKDSQPHNGDTDSSKFHSWLQNPKTEKLKFEKQPDLRPSPIKLFDEWENGSDFSSHSPNSCMTGENTDRIQTNQAQSPTVSFTPMVPNAESRNKSVRFDCEKDASSLSLGSSSSEIIDQESKRTELRGDYSVSKPSPYPTPLKLTDDMQTPGTVFPAYLHNNESGKNLRIRSQYVYPVLKPVENFSQLKALTEESYSSDHSPTRPEEHLVEIDKENPHSKVEKGALSVEKDSKVDASLSTWLRPKPGVRDFGRTPGDRPILGMVAAHWNADETSVSPKWWDGNGIPNSTNKYREDQKVSWHATPFEERLEKALSDDRLIVGRKQFETSVRIDLNEKEGGGSEVQSCGA